MLKKHAIIAAAVALSLGAWAVPAYAQASGAIKVENGGREVSVGGQKFSVSGSRTKITVGGKEASRGDLKDGMNCTVAGSGEASAITCK